MDNLQNIFVYSILLMIGLAVLQLIVIYKINKRIRDNIYSKKFISYQEFERDWIKLKNGKKGVAGYKYNDTSGCYVIMMFNRPVKNNEYKNYDNIYIGQSVKVCNRVHNHFNGKGNGDVYADIKYGKHVYVQLVPCRKELMNKTEKKLIQAFNATTSYNKTRGGAKLSY